MKASSEKNNLFHSLKKIPNRSQQVLSLDDHPYHHFFLKILCLFYVSLIFLISSNANARLADEQTLDEVVRAGGVNSVWGSPCTVLNVDRSRHPYGMAIVTITVNCNVIKAPPLAYVHPAFGEKWVQEGDGQTFRFHMLDPTVNQIADLKALPDVGKEFTLCLSGASQIGLSSPCALSSQAMERYQASRVSESAETTNGSEALGKDAAYKEVIESLSTKPTTETRSKGELNRLKIKKLVRKYYPEWLMPSQLKTESEGKMQTGTESSTSSTVDEDLSDQLGQESAAKVPQETEEEIQDSEEISGDDAETYDNGLEREEATEPVEEY